MPLSASDLERDHLPVLPEAVLRYLAPQPGQVCLDCTIGRAGHASLIVGRLSPHGRYIGLDADPANAEHSKQQLEKAGHPQVKIDVCHANFSLAKKQLDRLDVPGVDLLLADLGFASNQMDDPARGFAFSKAGPLDMRLDPSLKQTASDLVNTLPQDELAHLIFQYGEERYSRKIARKIIEARQQSPIKDTLRLAQLVQQVYHSSPRKHLSSKTQAGQAGRRPIHPATRTFMALRIAVNGELTALQCLLDQLPLLLNPGAIAVIISFHSLEDRLVKQAFARWHQQKLARKHTTKVVVADDQERLANPRSRSAKLRALRWGWDE